MDDLVLNQPPQRRGDAQESKIDGMNEDSPLMGVAPVAAPESRRSGSSSPRTAPHGSDFSGLKPAHKRHPSDTDLDFSAGQGCGIDLSPDELMRIGSKNEEGRFEDHHRHDHDREYSNFEDEFDPILASIRNPPQASPTASFASSSTVGGAGGGSGAMKKGSFPAVDRGGACGKDDQGGNSSNRKKAGVSFAAGLLSILPADMRARAGDVVAQSSANVSKTADAFRTALEVGISSAGGIGSRRPRDSDAPGIELEDGRGSSGGLSGQQEASSLEGENDVRVMNANELLSEEEVRVMAAYVV